MRFGEWLPLQYRRRKRLFRDRLTRVGLPTVVVDPPLRENLSAVMSAGLLAGGLNLLDKIAADSRLVDLGLVDGDRLRATIAATRAAADPQESDHQLFRVAAVELFLRCLAG